MENKTYLRVQIIINANSNAEIQESINWLKGAVHQSATEWPSESPVVKVLDEKPVHIEAKGTPPTNIISEKKEEASKVTLSDLRKKMSAVLKLNKRDEVKALLTEFEVPKLGELSEDKYEAFGKALDALLEEA